MRDIGGVFTKSDKEIRLWKIIRSNLPTGLSADNIKFLAKKGLSTIIDLRTPVDIQNTPNQLNQKGFTYHHVETKGSTYPDAEEKIPQGYLEIIDDTTAIRKIFEIIGTSKTGIIINCNAGKDRTGIIVLLLLLLADAYDEDIIADYQLSYTLLKKEVTQMHANNPKLPAWLGHSKAEYMEQTLQLFRTKYGDINSYLTYIGLDAEIITMVYEKLVS